MWHTYIQQTEDDYYFYYDNNFRNFFCGFCIFFKFMAPPAGYEIQRLNGHHMYTVRIGTNNFKQCNRIFTKYREATVQFSHSLTVEHKSIFADLDFEAHKNIRKAFLLPNWVICCRRLSKINCQKLTCTLHALLCRYGLADDEYLDETEQFSFASAYSDWYI